jgi:hypothetical protein
MNTIPPVTARPLPHAQQSLNMLQGDTKPIRRLVEARFDEIKAITEGSRPMLPPEVGSWCVAGYRKAAGQGRGGRGARSNGTP